MVSAGNGQEGDIKGVRSSNHTVRSVRRRSESAGFLGLFRLLGSTNERDRTAQRGGQEKGTGYFSDTFNGCPRLLGEEKGTSYFSDTFQRTPSPSECRF